MKKIYIKERKRRADEFQFFMHNFVDECIKNGIDYKPDIFSSYKWHLRSLCKRILLLVYKIMKVFRILPPKKNLLIITANGGTINENIFPYFFGYEFVPVLWDNWPSNYDDFIKSCRLFDIKTVFVTSSQVAEKINIETNIKAYWIYEGIIADIYKKGDELNFREKDVLELGRQMKNYHKVLENMSVQSILSLTSSHTMKNGLKDDKKLLYRTDEEMAKDIANHKIFICFPQCDTNPERAGEIETLTQRYWEGMLSRCLIIGRAPQELINIMGYNPVIEIDWTDPVSQIEYIIKNIEKYQSHVDKNYKIAIEKSSWDIGILKIIEVLRNL